MGRFFNLDSPVMVALTKMADLIIVNLLAFFCCLPIITVGASMTALHYVVLKVVRDEECYIVKSFFKSFKENFKQATVIWLIEVLLIIIFAADFWIIQECTKQSSVLDEPSANRCSHSGSTCSDTGFSVTCKI